MYQLYCVLYCTRSNISVLKSYGTILSRDPKFLVYGKNSLYKNAVLETLLSMNTVVAMISMVCICGDGHKLTILVICQLHVARASQYYYT